MTRVQRFDFESQSESRLDVDSWLETKALTLTCNQRPKSWHWLVTFTCDLETPQKQTWINACRNIIYSLRISLNVTFLLHFSKPSRVDWLENPKQKWAAVRKACCEETFLTENTDKHHSVKNDSSTCHCQRKSRKVLRGSFRQNSSLFPSVVEPFA